MKAMMLFVVKFTGSYALGVDVIRAENLECAEKVAKNLLERDEYSFFDKYTITHLPTEGGIGVVYRVTYIE